MLSFKGYRILCLAPSSSPSSSPSTSSPAPESDPWSSEANARQSDTSQPKSDANPTDDIPVCFWAAIFAKLGCLLNEAAGTSSGYSLTHLQPAAVLAISTNYPRDDGILLRYTFFL